MVNGKSETEIILLLPVFLAKHVNKLQAKKLRHHLISVIRVQTILEVRSDQ